MAASQRRTFVVEYFDPQANLTRTYLFVYHEEDKTIEMYDLKTKRVFLKRCLYPSFNPKELFIGATVNVFSRPLKLIDYGDEQTRRALSTGSREFMVAFSTNAFLELGHIVESLTSKDMRITEIRMVDIPVDVATRSGTTSRCVLSVVNGADAEEKVHAVCSMYGSKVSIIQDAGDAEQLRHLALGPSKSPASMNNCAVCVIKPHAITSGRQGAILQRLIDEGFLITALGMYRLTVADAEDFLEVYCGVVPEYKRLVEQMSSGPCWAIEVCAENVVQALRTVCGPHDPELCHLLFPHTLRSKFGIDRALNAVHCTDLEEDGPLESEFFFSLMQNMR